jgi:hypothetical protein
MLINKITNFIFNSISKPKYFNFLKLIKKINNAYDTNKNHYKTFKFN